MMMRTLKYDMRNIQGAPISVYDVNFNLMQLYRVYQNKIYRVYQNKCEILPVFIRCMVFRRPSILK